MARPKKKGIYLYINGRLGWRQLTMKDFVKFSNFQSETVDRILKRPNCDLRQRFVLNFLRENEIPEEKSGYSQDWPAYNKAQQNEKLILMSLLDELLTYIPFPERKSVGRKPFPFRDKIFHLVLQSYNVKSSRRCISDLEISRKLGYIEKKPHFNSVLKSLKDSSLTPYLKHLVEISGLPLQQVESNFATDSSGFGTTLFGRWFDVRTGTYEQKRRFMKCHLTCGVQSNIITAVNITNGWSADAPEFSDLIKKTSKNYNINEVSADKAYCSRENVKIVGELGGIPFIPFKSNIKMTSVCKSNHMWKKMLFFYHMYPDEFNRFYHRRSNVETVFHMIKRKFGSHLRSKTKAGQINEILAKCLCHNLCVLIQEALELGIELDFKKCAGMDIAHN
ncbi:transposase [Candidatus Woesearchaeota archaeon]|nr:transposase [Candidatus Woesearchaeota archaeon]